jgi:hypothetical protein
LPWQRQQGFIQPVDRALHQALEWVLERQRE